MLLEKLAEKAGERPEHDWEAYYRWYYAGLARRPAGELSPWQCPTCLTVNLVSLPVRHARCSGCAVIHLAR